MSHIYTIFPTTIYVGEVKDHKKHKEEFYKVYPKFDYEVNEHDNTVSENTGKVLLHLDDTLNPLFEEISVFSNNFFVYLKVVNVNCMN